MPDALQHQPLWTGQAGLLEDCAMSRFLRQVEQNTHQPLPDYGSLHKWSVRHPGPFWSELWDFCCVTGEKAGPALVNGGDIKDAVFFPEARLNYAENCLSRKGDAPAILFHTETGRSQALSWDRLADEVSIAQQILRGLGVGQGDRVAALMPNIPATVIYMLASASLGAVWSSCSPDFGAGAVIDRFQQIAPKVLLWANGYTYKAKWHAIADKVADIQAGLPTLNASLRIQFPGGAETQAPKGSLDEAALRRRLTATAPEFVRRPFNAPMLIMFSSGTSGPPKCIIHSLGGTLLQHLKEHQLHSDLRSGDRLFYFSTCSWMMWNWLVTGLASGAAIVLFDGSPFYPDDQALWRMAAQFEVTHFGTSPKYLGTLRKNGIRIRDNIHLPHLRVVLSTGAPLSVAGFRYVYEAIHSDVLLASISGGTDIVSCFLLGCPLLPVHAGELQCAGLGMDVRIAGEDGALKSQGSGDLVCAAPFPSRPQGFWGDADGQRYGAAYFATYDNVWCQHDRVERTATGGYIVHGRSDATLNPGGVRIGTAEIYRALEEMAEVVDAVVVGRTVEDDVEVVLFVMLKDNCAMTEGLIGRIKKMIQSRCTPRHVPALVVAVSDIPRTRNGKTSESAARAAVNNQPVANRAQLENPECLSMFSLGGKS